MLEIKFTREELFNLVWNESRRSLSKKYSISDNGIRKICLKHNIPLPPIGYWNNSVLPKRNKKPMLPKKYSGNNSITLRIKENNINQPSEIQKVNSLAKKLKSDPALPLTLPEKSRVTDKLVLAAKENLLSNNHHKWQYRNMLTTSPGFLKISVSKPNIKRALVLFDAFIKLVNSRNHKIEIVGSKTYVVVGSEKIEIRIQEKLMYVKNNDKYSFGEYQASGNLTIRTGSYNQKIWEDGIFKLEQQFVRILAWIEVKAEVERIDRLRREESWRKQAEQERIKKEKEERVSNEIKAFNELRNLANRWNESNSIRNYIEILENEAEAKEIVSTEFDNWIKWAKEKIDWYDPLINKKDLVLGEFNKQLISK